MSTTAELRARVFNYACDLDATLVPLGHRALAPAWRDALRRWLVDGTARTWVVRKGRRIGASTIICPRLVLAWIVVVVPTLHLPPGETVTIGLVSVKRGESENRIGQIAAHFDAVGIRYELREGAGEIDLLDMPVRIRIMTRNWRTAVGETIGLLWCDELSRWESGDDYSNPSEAVITSLLPSCLTIPASLVALVSSPWGLTDYHAQRYDLGDTAAQTTAFLPTWVGNPTLSESMLRLETPNEAVFLREYAAIPSATLEHIYLTPESVSAARSRRVPSWFHRKGAPHICIDASAGHPGGDSFAWMVLGWWQENPLQTFQIRQANNANGCEVRISPADGKPIRRNDRPKMDPILLVEFCDKLDAPFHDTWAPSRITKRIVADASTFGARYAHGDQFSEHSYCEHFRNEGVKMHYHNLSAASKPMACVTMRQWCDSGVIAIADSPGADALVKELQNYQELLAPSGTYKYSAPSGQHDDLVACILMAALSSTSDERTAKLGWESAHGSSFSSDDLTRQQYRRIQ